MDKKAYKAQWRKNNPDKLRIYENRATARAKEIILDMLGRQCASCGITDMRVLQIDHINGDGTAMRSSGTRGTRKLLAYMRKNGIYGFQILCANCNWIKRFEEKEGRYAVQVS